MFAVGTVQTRRPRASPRTKSSTGVPRVRPPAATICCAATLWEYWPPLTAPRYVYAFDEAVPGGRELLGGKGIGLAEMTELGVPVPAGFTITTEACRAYMANGGELPDGLEAEIEEHLSSLEEKTGKRFGDPEDPLLVSVRSGAAVSMPGMMDTILNLGLNDA